MYDILKVHGFSGSELIEIGSIIIAADNARTKIIETNTSKSPDLKTPVQ